LTHPTPKPLGGRYKIQNTATGQVAIFDATNTTEERRRLLIDTFHGRRVLHIICVCIE
jgi:predicted kinase